MDSKVKTEKIIAFLESAFYKAHINKAVLGWSGGIDSTVCLYLLTKVLPANNIHVLHLPYFISSMKELLDLQKNELSILPENIHEIPIKKSVDQIWTNIKSDYSLDSRLRGNDENNVINNKIRLGNIMARVRMIILFDFAKKINGLVCGTENKSEHLLGYFTRYGDAVSDIEPIIHLYKTQVYQLAKYLGVPEAIIKKSPSANLWDNQTDEEEFGFSYQEADKVLQGNSKGIDKEIVRKILERINRNAFKHKVPFTLT